MGDLRSLPKNRAAFYAAYRRSNSDDGDVAIRGIGGKFYRFIHVIKRGDLVLYPARSRIDKLVYVGFINGSYSYRPKMYRGFPHSRPIRWIGTFSKTVLSQGAVRELGAARTLFEIRNHADEILQLIFKLESDK